MQKNRPSWARKAPRWILRKFAIHAPNSQRDAMLYTKDYIFVVALHNTGNVGGNKSRSLLYRPGASGKELMSIHDILSLSIFILYFLYLIAPIKHPCDYNSYSKWWSDRSNWLSARQKSIVARFRRLAER